jgi:hypothetical protein
MYSGKEGLEQHPNTYVKFLRFLQVLKEDAPGVKKGGEMRQQKWCCGGERDSTFAQLHLQVERLFHEPQSNLVLHGKGEHHFDISYYAFKQLAHPLYGAMMLHYR